ncbi:hypothetical protein AMJ57_02430 [Parcubacteria bacterium SG8_24]|nr:MAG: hypothetical protein AMJ57_02430 [Parcubacteria bacterium SG8_24]
MEHCEYRNIIVHHYVALLLVAVFVLVGDFAVRSWIGPAVEEGQAAPAVVIPQSESNWSCDTEAMMDPLDTASAKPFKALLDPDMAEKTHCLTYHKHIQWMSLLSGICRDEHNELITGVQWPAECTMQTYQSKAAAAGGATVTRPRAEQLGQLMNLLRDYETQGIAPEDYDIVVVANGPGVKLLLTDKYLTEVKPKGGNPYEGLVKTLMSKGVTFRICLNTVRVFTEKGLLAGNYPANYFGEDSPVTPIEGNQLDAFIPGVEFVNSGIGAVADLQMQGYSFFRP